MPFRDLNIHIDTDGETAKLILENQIQYIKERIAFAKRITKLKVRYEDDLTEIDRLEWIAKAEAEMAKLVAALEKIVY